MTTKTEFYEQNYQNFMLSLKAKSLAQAREAEEDLLASLEARD
jgi:hypothetical protein